MTTPVAVVGATGFVGKHVSDALAQRGHEVRSVRAPRLLPGMDSRQYQEHVARLTEQFMNCLCVVNAAGIARAAAGKALLDQANGLMPALVAEAAATASLRMVHVSSAAVQGRRPVLDSKPEVAPFSPYSESKAVGELRLLENGHGDLCIYRPPGVHGRDRSVTQTIARIARGPLSTVASPGTDNTPQALVENVADAVAFLTTTELSLPRIVHHPSEGLTTESLLHALGGRPPKMLPRSLARHTIGSLYAGARARPGLEGQVRRVELLWLGQEQAPSWLSKVGWRPVAGADRWIDLGRQFREALGDSGNEEWSRL